MSTLNDANAETQPYAAWIGLDWADQKHFWSMRTADGQGKRGHLDNTPEAVEVWGAELAQHFGGRPVAVALEQARGAVIGMLSKYAHLILFPVHSTTLANYRKSFSPSGAKSDPQDGDLILDLLLKHSERLRRLQPDTVETRSLQFLTQERRKLVDLYTAESQRLINWLKQVFPQILRWFDNPATPLVGDLLLRWPTLQQLQKASPKTLLHFLHQHNCRSEERIQQRLAEIRQAMPAITDAALLATGTLCIQNSIRALAQMRIGMAAFDRQIAGTYRSHPDRAIVESFPGAGPALEPRLIAAVGSQRDRFDSATSMACFTGIAPVQESSGNSCWTHCALGLSEVHPANFPRMGRLLDPYLPLGTRLLRPTACQGKGPSRRATRLGLQVDSHLLPLLAGSRALLRATLPPSPAHSCDPAQPWPTRFSASVTAADAVEKLCRVLQTRAAFLLTD